MPYSENPLIDQKGIKMPDKTTFDHITPEEFEDVEAVKTRNPLKKFHRFASENNLYAPILMIGAAGISLATVIISSRDTQQWLGGLDRLASLEQDGTMLLVADSLSEDNDPLEVTEE